MAEGVLLGARSLPESAAGILDQLRRVVLEPGVEKESDGIREGEQEVRRVAAILHASVINKLPKGELACFFFFVTFQRYSIVQYIALCCIVTCAKIIGMCASMKFSKDLLRNSNIGYRN